MRQRSFYLILRLIVHSTTQSIKIPFQYSLPSALTISSLSAFVWYNDAKAVFQEDRMVFQLMENENKDTRVQFFAGKVC